jgi:lysophospholipase L1-like esterase
MLLSTAALRADILVKTGEKVAFMGDSITEGGWGNPKGYVRLVMAGLAANGITAEAAPAGVSGHKSNQMLERLDRDALSKKPQWMTLSCGVNDVWHGANGVPLEKYKDNISKIVEQCTAAGVKVVILTATVIQEVLDNPENQKLAAYNDFLRQLAKDKNLPLADLNAMFQERIKAENKPGQKVLTADGVHMNEEGNKVMARGVLKAFGLDDAQLAKAVIAWAEIK